MGDLFVQKKLVHQCLPHLHRHLRLHWSGKKQKKLSELLMSSRERNQLPSTYVNDDIMRKDGNYSDVEFESMDESSFNNFLKFYVTFGEMFTKDYYMHSLSSFKRAIFDAISQA